MYSMENASCNHGGFSESFDGMLAWYRAGRTIFPHGATGTETYSVEGSNVNEGGFLESFGGTEDSHTARRTISLHGDTDSEKKDGSYSPQFEMGSAFLGPNLCEQTYRMDDFQLEYMDLEEFLSVNGMPGAPEEASQPCHGSSPVQPPAPPQAPRVPLPPTTQPSPTLNQRSPLQHSHKRITHVSPENTDESFPEVDFAVPPQDLALVSIPGQDDFDPRKRKFTDDDLKPQPVMKKSKKVFVPDCAKDDRYWSRRKKNNVAAKRSRDARRIKENQIAMRACYLEKANTSMKEEVEKLRRENSRLKTVLSQSGKQPWHTSTQSIMWTT